MTGFWRITGTRGRSFWNRSLATQLVGFMLVALLLSQGISFLIYSDEHDQALRATLKEEFLLRSASVARLLEATPAVRHADILRAVDTSYTRFWVTTDGPDDVVAWRTAAWRQLRTPLPENQDADRAPAAPSGISESLRSSGADGAVTFDRWDQLAADAWPLGRPARYVRLDNAFGAGLVVPLQSGHWLNAAIAKSKKPAWMSQSAVSLAISAVLLSLLAVLVARRIARPLRRLARAAEALGRGEAAVQLPEDGPDDIRGTAEAFNRMQDRLRRFVADRTAMLAAIGHDLRTPITSLRLRAEFVADEEMREKILATLDEMQVMTEATLAFAREDAAGEPTRLVDLAALAESVCDDLADLGSDVRFSNGERIPYRCRPAALRRAIRNLVENAVRYGERARVTLSTAGDGIEIGVDDDGRGIPEAECERVFAPFVRLEVSRSRATGGVGLGLSVARTIARSHGGDIVLLNRPEGGLRAVLRLPQAPAGEPSAGRRPSAAVSGREAATRAVTQS